MEAEQRIWQYLVEEKGCTEVVANLQLDKIVKYADIRDEFLHWLEKRDYIVEEPVVVEGYNALAIVDRAPMLDGIGVYNMLVDLREKPEVAKMVIAEGFAVK